ncbi:MAG: radical SAM protein [Alphaproteobacteria bacterium]|nr:radical SAM protein [Alphaproteobacteria bacterium]
MAPRTRPYLFYDVAISICPTCYRKVEGKILIQDGRVLLRRRCPEHGGTTTLLADDVDYYRKAREVWVKPPEMPQRYNTPIRYGCPYDCGLCPDHEQHSCLSIVELTDHCNLRCPVCYAGSGPEAQRYRSFEQVLAMLDAVVANEGEPDVVQLSGGEPTLHPDLFRILDACKERPIRHLMLNTNGVRIAKEPEFAARLAEYLPGFEVYLQFDSFEKEPLMRLRGADLRDVRRRAIEHLNAHGLHTTLVVTVQKGLNDHELGRIVEYGLAQPCVRGVTFQPTQHAGRADGYDPARDRLTLTEVRRLLLEQTAVFAPEDVLPVPCHPDSIAMAYALTLDDHVAPLTGLIPPEVLLEGPRNTIAFEKQQPVRDWLLKLFATNHSPESQATTLKSLLCCLPRVDAPTHWSYDKLFRVIIMDFMDAWSFDVRSVKKSCVHIVDPETLNLVPFDTYNLFYRGDLARERLAPLRRRLEDAGMV